MSAAKHTPGPWIVEQTEADPRLFVWGSHGQLIADVGNGNENTRANGRLISAAPDMQRALTYLLQRMDGTPGNHHAWPEYKAALAAVAKSRTEP